MQELGVQRPGSVTSQMVVMVSFSIPEEKAGYNSTCDFSLQRRLSAV